MLREIFCALTGEDDAFSVKIEPTESVDALKDVIWEKWKNTTKFRDVGAPQLTLYRIDAQGVNRTERIKNLRDKEKNLGEPLDEIRKLWRVFKKADLPENIHPNNTDLEVIIDIPEGVIHISVALPPAELPENPLLAKPALAGTKRDLPMDLHATTPTMNPLIARLAFSVNESYDYESQEVLNSNNINAQIGLLPGFIKDIERDLGQPLRTSDIHANHLTKLMERFSIDFLRYFTTQDGNGTPISDLEFSHYSTLISSYRVNELINLAYGKQHLNLGIKEGFVRHYLGSFLHCLCDANPTGAYQFGTDWPFPLVAKTKVASGKYEYFRYQPKSDCAFRMDNCPCIVVEVISDANQKDRNRMLLQCGALVRDVNSTPSQDLTKANSFVVIAIYIDAGLNATRYLVYQPDLSNDQVEYTQKSYELTNSTRAFEFFWELNHFTDVLVKGHNRLWLQRAQSHLEGLKKEINRLNLPGLIPMSKKRSKNNHPGPSGGGEGPTPYEDTGVVRQLAAAGFEVLPMLESHIWIPVSHLRPNLRCAKRTTGQAAILKLVEPNEFTLLKLLSSIKSRENRLIPLLKVFPFDVGTIIAMPAEQELGRVPIAFVQTHANHLLRQFLEGVRFLHQHRVGHLDLKPENLVVSCATSEPQLFIIDLSLSVQVPDYHYWMEGYRGTPGWAAPEIGDEEGPAQRYQPIRADLWSAGRVLQYFADRYFPETNFPYQWFMLQLLNEDPLKRPLLNLIPLDQVPHRLKRRLESNTLGRMEKRRFGGLVPGILPEMIVDTLPTSS